MFCMFNKYDGFIKIGEDRLSLITLSSSTVTVPQLLSFTQSHVLISDLWVFSTLLFQGRNGRAFLFSHAMNITVGRKEDRNLMTGLHTVADISCADCCEVLGWKYERAYEPSQKYKEGKFILEKSKIVNENW
ncbi:hypothetical protein AgCh_009616 [Apium graveolens]